MMAPQFVLAMIAVAWLAYAYAGFLLGRQLGHGRQLAATRPGVAAAAGAVLLPVALWCCCNAPVPLRNILHGDHVGSLLLVAMLVALPFYFLGRTVLLTAMQGDDVGRIHAVVLTGLGVGTAGATWLLAGGVPAPRIALLSGAVMAAGSAVFGGGRFAALALLTSGAWLLLGGDRMHVPAPEPKTEAALDNLDSWLAERKGKAWWRGRVYMRDGTTRLIETPWPPDVTADRTRCKVIDDDGPAEIVIDDVEPNESGALAGRRFDRLGWREGRHWTVDGRIDTFHWPDGLEMFWLYVSSAYFALPERPLPRQKAVLVDGQAYSSVLRYSGAPLFPPGTREVDAARESVLLVEYLLSSTAYQLTPRPGRVLCLFAGGGVEVLAARYHGADHVLGVEPHAPVVAAVRGAFQDFSGRLYDPERSADIDVVVAPPREFLERTDQRFDIITMPHPETRGASLGLPLHFLENDVLSREGLVTCLRRLRPGGVLALGSWFAVDTDRAGSQHPTFSLRLVATARDALSAVGVAEPRDCLFLLRDRDRCLLLVKPTAFREEELNRLEAHCSRMWFSVLYGTRANAPPLIRMNSGFTPNPYLEFLGQDDAAAGLRADGLDRRPTTDARPTFQELRDPTYLGGFPYDRDAMLTTPRVLWYLLGLWAILYIGSAFLYPRQSNRRAPAWRVKVWFCLNGAAVALVMVFLPQYLGSWTGYPTLPTGLLLPATLLGAAYGAARVRTDSRPATLTLAMLALLALLLERYALPAWRDVFPLFRMVVATGLVAVVGIAAGTVYPASVHVLTPGGSPQRAWTAATFALGGCLGLVVGAGILLADGYTGVLGLAPLAIMTTVLLGADRLQD